MTDFYTGDIVFTCCHLTGKAFRPHIVTNVTKDGRVALCPLTHTPQGRYEITELGGGTYLAAVDKFTRQINLRFTEAGEDVRLGRPNQQISDEAITAALAEIKRQISCR